MEYLKIVAFLVVLLYSCNAVNGNKYNCYCNDAKCKDEDLLYTAIGCYRENKTARDLPELLFTLKNVDWKKYLCCDLLCQCAKAAKQKNYMYFGIQRFKECWAGNSYGNYGEAKAKKCKSCDLKKKCKETDGKHCVGGKQANYVYKVEDLSCEGIEWKNIKLFHCGEDNRNNRRLKNPAVQGRKPEGAGVSWKFYEVFLPQFLCKCAKKALAADHRYFGIQFWGECWTGNKYGQPRIDSEKCQNECYEECDIDEDRFCTGKRWVNAVYRFKKKFWKKRND